MNWINPKSARYAWIVVALLVPVALLNYLDRQMLAAMKFSLMTDIPDIGSEANWGKILALFKWTYAFLSPIGGYLSDRFSRRHAPPRCAHAPRSRPRSLAGAISIATTTLKITGHRLEIRSRQ